MRGRSVIVLRELSSTFQLPWGVSNAKNMDTTRKPVEDKTCAKCSEKGPDHMEEDCLKEIQCANCRQDHLAYTRFCVVYKKEKEIIEVKRQRNVSFLEARRIVGSYKGESSYASCTEGG